MLLYGGLSTWRVQNYLWAVTLLLCIVEPSDRILVNFAQKWNICHIMEYKIISKEPGSRPATGWTMQDSNPNRVKRRGRIFYHSPPSNAEVKNEWSYTPAPPTCYQNGIYNLLKIKFREIEEIMCNWNKSERIGYVPLAASSEVNTWPAVGYFEKGESFL